MPTPDVMPHPAAVEFLLSYLIAPERNISLTERNVHLQSNKDLSLNPEETGRMNGRRWQEIEEELDLSIPFFIFQKRRRHPAFVSLPPRYIEGLTFSCTEFFFRVCAYRFTCPAFFVVLIDKGAYAVYSTVFLSQSG